jgi:hypothetical protein
LEAKGKLVTLEVLSMPFKNGDGVDGSGCFAMTGAVNEAFAVEPLVALAAA